MSGPIPTEDGRARTCPSCGARLPSRPTDRAGDRLQSGHDQTESDRDQTLSDRDQTTNDAEQTSADRDQAASDDDQRTSNEDQHAADHDLAAGSDRTIYQKTTSAREQTTAAREATSHGREQTGHERLESAANRDIAAALRDLGAETRDAIARRRDQDDPGGSREQILARARHDRERAAVDRERAADDRAQAAADRQLAARERAEAARLRSVSDALLQQAATDQLTGARTRFFGLDEASRELERAARSATPLLLVLVDVDGLGRLDETRGQLAGDALLRLVVGTLRAHLRPDDVIVRYGSDEFLCVLPELSMDDVEGRFARIAVDLAAVDAAHSISCGLAEARPGERLERLIERADADLRARRSGGRAA